MPLTAHFGLGESTNVDTLRIEWPSGAVQEFHQVSPRQILTITEPPRLLTGTTNGLTPELILKGGRNLWSEIQTSTDLRTWSPMVTLTVTNLNGIAQIAGPDTLAQTNRFFRARSL